VLKTTIWRSYRPHGIVKNPTIGIKLNLTEGFENLVIANSKVQFPRDP